MKTNIAILGSTGSIGNSLLKIISKDKKKFNILLLTANKNYKELINQTKKFQVKNVIITDKSSLKKFKKYNKNQKIKIYDNFKSLNKIFTKKIDYTMSSIVGIEGLEPTINMIKYTKKIAIANKESIICAWNLLKKKLKKYKTQFIPVDSEHFSIWYGLKNNSFLNVEKIFLTASGGPLLNIDKKNYDKLKINQIIKHPNWQMGKKISVDSSTMMNKVFEVIEAKKLFNISYKKISIIIHPKSYIHAIIKFNDGMIKLIAHETTMEIPILNTLQNNLLKTKKTHEIKFNDLNNLNLTNINNKKFPLTNILKKLPTKDSLYETILISANDQFVKYFLDKKITYSELLKKIETFISKKEFSKYKQIEPKKVSDILNLNKYIRSKILSIF